MSERTSGSAGTVDEGMDKGRPASTKIPNPVVSESGRMLWFLNNGDYSAQYPPAVLLK